MAEFRYKQRTAADIARRKQEASNDFPSAILEEFTLYKMRKGENWVRILPNTWDPEQAHYGMTVYYHGGVGPDNATVLCLYKMKNKKCPLCEAAGKLKASGDDEEGKSLGARKRVWMLIVDMKEPDKGVQVFDCPPRLDTDITANSQDRRTKEVYPIDSPDEGYDVFFDKEGEKLNTKYVGVNIAREPTKLPKKFLNDAIEVPLPDRLKWRTAAEMLAIYSGGADADEDELPPPRRRTRDDVDEDEIPFDGGTRTTRRRQVDEEPEVPSSRGRSRLAEPEEEEEVADEAPPPRRASRVSREPEPEEEAPPPPRRARLRQPEAVPEDEEEPAPRRRAARQEPEEEEAPPPRTALRERLANRNR
jgi:hypothetical protein